MLAIPVKACVASSADVLPKVRAALILEQNPAHTDLLLLPRPDRGALEKELSRFINLREVENELNSSKFLLNSKYYPMDPAPSEQRLWLDARRVEIQAARSDPNVETALVRYSAALCHAKVALGASLDENVAFRFMWRDAFKPTLVAHSRSVSFERCCSLYNLGAFFSQRAALVNRNDLAGVRDAKEGFQRAAGVFEHVKALLGDGGFRALGVQTNAPSPPQGAAVGLSGASQGMAAAAAVGVTDLSTPGLDMAMALMLAQAQACCYEEALKGGTAASGTRDPAVIAQLAAGASAMYGDALACVHASPQLVELDKSWQRHLHFQSACFEAVACWWRAKELAASVGSAKGPIAVQQQQQERVGRLRAAIAACDKALAPPPIKGAATSSATNEAYGGLAAGLAAQAQGLKSMAMQELVQAQLASAGVGNNDDDSDDQATVSPPPLPELVVRRVAEPIDIAARLAHTIADEKATDEPLSTSTAPEEGYSVPAASTVVEGLDLLDNFTTVPNTAVHAGNGDVTDEPLPLKGLLSRSLRAAATEEWTALATAAQKSSHAALALGSRGRAALEPKRMATEAFAMSQGRIPDGLWERVAEWQASGGEEALRKQVQVLDTVATEAKERMEKAQKVLETEEGASARFLSLSEACGDPQRIALCGSAGTALQTLAQRLKKLQVAWGGARESDAKLASTLADAPFVEGSKLLNLGRNELAQQAAAAQANDKAFAAQVATAQAAAAATGSSATAAAVPTAVESDALGTSLLDGTEASSPILAPSAGTAEHADRVAALTSAVDAAAFPLTRALAQTTAALKARDAIAQALASALPARGGPNTEALVAPLWRKAAAVVARPAVTGTSGDAGAVNTATLLDVSCCGVESSMRGGEAASPREAVKLALAPLHVRVTAFDTVLNAPVNPGDSLDADGLAKGEPLLSRAGQEYLLASVEALATRFNEALSALREVSGDTGSSSSRLAAVLEHALTASSAARAQLEQGERWYADLASRLSAVAAEIEDHAFAQEVLRKDFGVASQQEDDDEALARRLQSELAEEEDASNAIADAEAATASSSAGTTSPPLPPPDQPPQQPQQQQAAAVDGKTQLATKVPEGVGPGGRIKITLPGSGIEIELVVPEGMASGEMLEFLVPNSLLRPPDAHLNDIVIVNKRQAEQAAVSNATPPPPQSQPHLQPPPSQHLHQPPQRHAPPAHPHPPSFGGSSSSRVGTPASPHSGTIPDYSQSARSSSSEPLPAANSSGGVKETAEKAWANISSGFSSVFGGGPNTYPARPQQTPLVDTRTNEVAGVPRFTPQQAPSRSAPTPAPAPEPEVTLDPAVVAQLKDMGFAEDVVVAALIANRGDAERALNTLLTADETAALSASMN